MARARNIKPAFFDNDDLAENEPLGRLLFIGMWTIADYKGDFVWREKRIKAKLLPYDDCDVRKLAINLDNSGFIRFYSEQGAIYCNIPNFKAHQNPHKNEKENGSKIPAYTEDMRQVFLYQGFTINRDKNGTVPDKVGTAPADSLLLIPSYPNPESQKAGEAEGTYLACARETTGDAAAPTSLYSDENLMLRTGADDIKPQQESKAYARNEDSGVNHGSNGSGIPCPYEKLVEIFHRTMPNNPEVLILTNQKKVIIKAGWDAAATSLLKKFFEYQTVEKGLEEWEDFFKRCNQVPFLIGQGKIRKGWDSPFMPTFEWFFDCKNIENILTQKYTR